MSQPRCPSALGSLPSQCLQAASPGKSPLSWCASPPTPLPGDVRQGRESPHHPPSRAAAIIGTVASARSTRSLPGPHSPVLRICKSLRSPAAPQGSTWEITWFALKSQVSEKGLHSPGIPLFPTARLQHAPSSGPAFMGGLKGIHLQFCFECKGCCCSARKSCLTLCYSMDCSTPGSSVLHYLLESAQIHVQ